MIFGTAGHVDHGKTSLIRALTGVSGSVPLSTLPGVALTITPRKTRKVEALKRLAAAFRALPTPVIGRMDQDAFCLASDA